MKFILHEIKLWFKDENATPISYNFLPDKVNVITGGATTGKTSFWSIIDYCFLSGKVNIASSIIETVEWFGLSFTINGKTWSIIRKSPSKGHSSADICFVNGGLPKEITINNSIAAVRSILDAEFGITDTLRFPQGKNNGKVGFNLSFRYFLLFNSLTEDIIGTSANYFDTIFYGKDEYEQALKHIFDLVLGVNDMENIKSMQMLNQVNNEIKRIEKGGRDAIKKQTEFDNEVLRLLEKTRQFGFLEYNQVIETVDEALRVISEVVSQTLAVAENSGIYQELDTLRRDREALKARLSELSNYKKEYENYKKTLDKCADSLEPIVYLNENLSGQLVQSYETKVFLDSLESSLTEIRNSLTDNLKEPKVVSGDTAVLQRDIKAIDSKIEKLDLVKKGFMTEGQRLVNLGEIKSNYERLIQFESPKALDSLRLNELNVERERLEKIPLEHNEIRNSLKEMLNRSIQRNYNQLNSLPAYSDARTVFNTSEMILQLYPNGEIFPLENVGSKSNYMMMHLCFYLGLHEHMMDVGQVHVPQFLFIDQPSIPYYADSDQIKNEDKTKLLDAFSLINNFVKNIVEEKKDSFQVFMVEHAPESYWLENNLTYFHTIDQFIDGKGLIPADIFKTS